MGKIEVNYRFCLSAGGLCGQHVTVRAGHRKKSKISVRKSKPLVSRKKDRGPFVGNQDNRSVLLSQVCPQLIYN